MQSFALQTGIYLRIFIHMTLPILHARKLQLDTWQWYSTMLISVSWYGFWYTLLDDARCPKLVNSAETDPIGNSNNFATHFPPRRLVKFLVHICVCAMLYQTKKICSRNTWWYHPSTISTLSPEFCPTLPWDAQQSLRRCWVVFGLTSATDL